MDLCSCFVCYVEPKLAPTDTIWLFSVQTYVPLTHHIVAAHQYPPSTPNYLKCCILGRKTDTCMQFAMIL